jgi:hypothetical protein
MIQLIWPNGEMSSGRTWVDAEDAVRASQWTSYASQEDFRDEMRKRATVWCGTIVPYTDESEAFLRSLGDVNMFMIVDDTEEEEDE